jgi:sugar O-acyltransferase (sialic acid O-acetyltransferase NeuD family)
MPARKPLLLLGAGGASREVAEAADTVGDFDVLGFLDDDPAKHGTTVSGRPVLGPLDEVADHPDALLIAGMGNPRAPRSRERVVARLGLGDERFATVVHPLASCPPSCSLGAGSVLLAGTVLTADVTVGRHVLAMPGCVLTHDDVVEDYASLAAGVLLAGGVRVGRGAYLGAGVRVRENLGIGSGALIGMGSLVLREVGPEEVWYGSPARRISGPDAAGELRSVG